MSILAEVSKTITGVLIGATSAIIISFYFSMAMRRKLPIAHNVAVIGFPKSGKTTLITALFAEIFARKIQGISITPRGEETINRVNEDIAKLERGEKLGATTDQDLFAYRAEMIAGKGIFAKRYKIEIGDFPGEDSEDLSTKEVQWLHKLPYFNWVLNADAFIFVVDSEKLLKNDLSFNYVTALSSSFRAAWQKLKDHHYDGARKLHNKPIVLVFTKCDLFHEDITNVINAHYGGSKKMPLSIGIAKQIIPEFNDLIEFLNSESSRFSLVFSSSFKKDPDTKVRIGAKEVLSAVLPK